MTQKREELADEFLAEPKRIDPQTINGFDKQQASAAVVRNINDIQTHVATHGNRLIANLGFNMTKDGVTFDEDFFGTADNKTRTNMSLMNFNTLMSFYKDIGLERFATKMLIMKKMMGELNEYSA